MLKIALLAVGLLLAAPAAADVVHFINGDRLTGAVSEAQGSVTIEVPGVGPVVVPREQVASIERAVAEPEPEPAAEEPEESAEADAPLDGFWSAWDIRIDAGAIVATGNTREENLSFNIGAKRGSERFDHILGTAAHVSNARGETTKNQFDFNYDLRWKFTADSYVVTSFDFFRDPIKNVDQRFTVGGGLGHTLWRSERGSLNTDAGISQVFETLDDGGGSSSDPALRWNLNFNRWLEPERWELFHNNRLLRILAADRGMVWNSDTGVRFHLNSHWQAGLRLRLQHETEPAGGRRGTDASYTVTLGGAL